MAERRSNLGHATLPLLVAAVTTSCAATASSSVSPDSAASATAADSSPAADPAIGGNAGALDPALAAALQQGVPFAALVTVADTGPATASATATGVLPGPYSTVKSMIVNSFPAGVRLLRDYDQFGLIEVEIADRAGLTELLAIPGVTKVTAEGRVTTAGTT